MYKYSQQTSQENHHQRLHVTKFANDDQSIYAENQTKRTRVSI